MADSLLAPPQHGCKEYSKLERRICTCEDLSSRFRVTSRRFTQQYSQIYAVRLMATRPVLERAAKKKWGKFAKKKVEISQCARLYMLIYIMYMCSVTVTN